MRIIKITLINSQHTEKCATLRGKVSFLLPVLPKKCYAGSYDLRQETARILPYLQFVRKRCGVECNKFIPRNKTIKHHRKG